MNTEQSDPINITANAPGAGPKAAHKIADWLRPWRFRGKTRLMRTLVPTHGRREADLFGVRVELDLANPMDWLIYIGDFERPESAWVQRQLRPGMTFVDAGANMGYYSFLAASVVGPTGRVLAFEPDPKPFRRLAETVRANALTNLHVFAEGLGDQPGRLPLYLSESDEGVATLVPDHQGTALEIPIRTLDDVLAEQGIKRVDILKMDVEGFEPKLLAGATKSIRAGYIRAVLCELNDKALKNCGSSMHDLYKQLNDFGFRDTSPKPLRTDTWLESRSFVFDGGKGPGAALSSTP